MALGRTTAWKNGKIRAGSREQQHKNRRASGIPTGDLSVFGGGSDAEKALDTRPRYDDESDAAIFEQPARSRISRACCLDILCFAGACPRDWDLDCPS